jgi:hypothetical protein
MSIPSSSSTSSTPPILAKVSQPPPADSPPLDSGGFTSPAALEQSPPLSSDSVKIRDASPPPQTAKFGAGASQIDESLWKRFCRFVSQLLGLEPKSGKTAAHQESFYASATESRQSSKKADADMPSTDTGDAADSASPSSGGHGLRNAALALLGLSTVIVFRQEIGRALPSSVSAPFKRFGDTVVGLMPDKVNRGMNHVLTKSDMVHDAALRGAKNASQGTPDFLRSVWEGIKRG